MAQFNWDSIQEKIMESVKEKCQERMTEGELAQLTFGWDEHGKILISGPEHLLAKIQNISDTASDHQSPDDPKE